MKALVIFDKEEGYAKALMEYISSQKGLPFEVVAFSDLERLQAYACDSRIDVLLYGDLEEEALNGIDVDKKIRLIEQDGENKEESIFKYQSAESILNEILDRYVDIGDARIYTTAFNSRSEIIGVYSPIGRSGKTSFAITLGQILQNKGDVLYINLEEFSGFGGMFNKDYKGDLSDLMYHYQQNSNSIAVKLKTVVSSIHGMEYIPPMVYSADIRNVDITCWIELIKDIASLCLYEYIILDFSSMPGDIFKLLDICKTVYMPISNEHISMCKISEYEEYLFKTQKEELIDKTVKIKLPPCKEEWNENYIQELVWGDLGDFVRKVIEEDAA